MSLQHSIPITLEYELLVLPHALTSLLDRLTDMNWSLHMTLSRTPLIDSNPLSTHSISSSDYCSPMTRLFLSDFYSDTHCACHRSSIIWRSDSLPIPPDSIENSLTIPVTLFRLSTQPSHRVIIPLSTNIESMPWESRESILTREPLSNTLSFSSLESQRPQIEE